jgi:signal transduction histidine kinase
MIYFNEDAEDLYQNAPFGYLTICANGTILNANKTLLSWLNIKREELIEEKTFMDLLGIGDRIFYETHIVPMLQMQWGISEINLTIVGPHYSFPALINGKKVPSNNQSNAYYRFSILNISQRKQFEMELIQAREEADNALLKLQEVNQKLEQFAYLASHDLQAPLNTIIGMFSLLEKKGLISKEAEDSQYYSLIKSNISKMKLLISDLLEFSKIGSSEVQFSRVYLNDVFKEAIQSLNDAIQESNAKIYIENLPIIMGERMLLVRLFQNLISNALKFRTLATPIINIQCKQDHKFTTIRISDNGIGIDPKYSKQIFGFMKRLHTFDSIPGTGIGLAACKSIVEIHGGTIEVESEKGKGSTFVFTLYSEIQ